MKVRWEDIPPEGREIAVDELFPLCLEGPYGEAEQEAEAVSETKGKLFFQRTPKGIQVTGRIRTALSLHCARCLKEFILPIEMEFEECFIHMKDAPRDDDTELLQDDMDVSFLPEGGIEIKDIVEEQLWLNIPIKPLCHDGCKGLCSICGKDLNLGECGCDRRQSDPRFAVLHSFKQNLPHGRI
jgi:uncharacterized protein